MVELKAEYDNPLITVLSELNQVLSEDPSQPVVQLAEGIVAHWHRVVGGLDLVQPRLNEAGFLPTAFNFGMEENPGNRIDDCGITEEEGAFEKALEAGRNELLGHLRGYFSQSGYRSSSDQCDNLMVQLARMSRFIGTWALEAELMKQRNLSLDENERAINIYKERRNPSLLWSTRWNLAYWEPLLNVALSAWEGNSLENFHTASRLVLNALELGEAEQRKNLPPPGYPIRGMGLARLTVFVQQPDYRPLRTRSVLWVRYNQLVEHIQDLDDKLSKGRMEAIITDVLHFLRMVENNLFMHGFETGFLAQGRAGVPAIRGRPGTHMILLDPQGFFKKAVLFHNGTYTIAGGGIDRMYLQLRQLERYYKFDGWGGIGRIMRPLLDETFIAWEENKWREFTEGLLQVATVLRDEDDARNSEST